VRCILFNDKSFEIVITDITRTEQNKAMRQQMTSNIAHELKTPIPSVRGYLETLIVNKDLDEEKRNHFLDKALGQAARLTDLINDIVTLNKLDETGSNFPFSEVDVADVVREVCDNLMTDIRSKQMKVDIAIEPGTMVNGNRSLIVSVFQNLLENAITYAGEKVTVTVRTLPGESGFRTFSFADNGIGIPAEHQERIFERFYRIDDGRSRKSGGTGLGLAIVKNAVLLHRERSLSGHARVAEQNSFSRCRHRQDLFSRRRCNAKCISFHDPGSFLLQHKIGLCLPDCFTDDCGLTVA
jgi:two-component system OmpR family sensor kinase/two-component system phosphate regulon sensor histidine kinase PhoR